MATLFKLFQETQPINVLGGRGGLSQFLSPGPGGTGAVDVVDRYRWTLTDPKGRTETPYIVLTEFRLLLSSLMNSARYYISGAATSAGAALGLAGGGAAGGVGGDKYLSLMPGYQGLFDYDNPTGFWYRFPYFNEVSNEVSSTWTSLDILEKVKGFVSALSPGLAKVLEQGVGVAGTVYEANYPRVGIMDRPKLWEQSTPRSINIKFPLYNTVEEIDIQNNWELCYLLLYQNMFNKRDFVTALPPVFYTVYAPGQFFSIAMYVSDLKIYNRGNLRHTKVGGKGRNVPDVYEVDMTLTDMIMPSQNMLSVLRTEDPVIVQKINENRPVTSEGASAPSLESAFATGTLPTLS